MLEPKIIVNAQTQLYGILGNPVRHSLSPLIHNTLFDELKINAVYLAFEIEKDLLGPAFESIRSLDIRGVNLTIPFKEPALNFIDEIPEDIDRCVGALNTVINRGGKLIGFNTDVPGFLIALKEELGFNPEAKKILVLGAGGAARGVVFALAQGHADKILIHNRTGPRAEGLRDYLSKYFPETEIDSLGSLNDLKTEKIDLVVNATPCGMTGHESPLDLRLLHKAGNVYDLVYTPAQTPFLKQAKELGLPCANGMGMLAAQAALSFQLWTGHQDGLRARMSEILKKCLS